MTTRPDPGIYRRRVRAELRDARTRMKKTQQDVADDLDWSLSKMIRIESGVVTVSTTDLKALMDYYGIDDPDTRQRLVEDARRSRERPWWFPYRDVVRSQLPQLLAYESEASEIRTYSPSLITALLQTPAYALRLRRQTIDDEARVSMLVELLTKRQEILHADGAPKAVFIVDIAPLRRWVGRAEGPKVMIEQLNHLKYMATLPNVTIRILPDEAGEHSAMNGPFVLLSFEGDDDKRHAVFLEGTREDILNHEDAQLIEKTIGKFKQLEELALTEDETSSTLDDLIARFAAAR